MNHILVDSHQIGASFYWSLERTLHYWYYSGLVHRFVPGFSAKRSLNPRYCEFFSHIEITDNFQQRRDLVETIRCYGFDYNCDSYFLLYWKRFLHFTHILFFNSKSKFQILLHVGFAPDRMTDFRRPCVFLYYICHCISIIFVWLLVGPDPLIFWKIYVWISLNNCVKNSLRLCQKLSTRKQWNKYKYKVLMGRAHINKLVMFPVKVNEPNS